MSTYVLPLGSGLGDAIVSFPILQHLIESGERTFLVARSHRQENLEDMIPGLSGIITEPDFLKLELTDGDRCLNFRAHPLQTQYVWGSRKFDQAYPGFKVNDILKTMCKDFGLDVEFTTLRPLLEETREEAMGKVLLVPGTVCDSKSWPISYWCELIALLSASGKESLVIGEPERNSVVSELVNLGYSWLKTPRVSDALRAINSASAVVSVDTGLMHLSVHQGRPTVVLFGNLPVYYRPYTNCFPILVKSCSELCLSGLEQETKTTEFYEVYTWYDGQFEQCKVEESERCMYSITPQAVFEKLEQIAQPKSPANVADR